MFPEILSYFLSQLISKYRAILKNVLDSLLCTITMNFQA